MREYSREKYRLNDIGTQFGDWIQVGPSFRNCGVLIAVMECGGCGKHYVVKRHHAKNGASRGCIHCSAKKSGTTTGQGKHRMSRSSEYRTYYGMLDRCQNPKNSRFRHYGGRGIKVCEQWQGEGGFEAFFLYIGRRPQGCELDRIDNNGNYEPGNVQWSTRSQNNRNKRTNSLLTIDGTTRCVTEWSQQPGALPRHQIYKRAKEGMPAALAVFGG